jgi:hypothetical protein
LSSSQTIRWIRERLTAAGIWVVRLGDIDYRWPTTAPQSGKVLKCIETGGILSWEDDNGGEGGGTPSGTVATETAFGQSSSAGSASAYSRGDHTHGTPAAPTYTSVGACSNTDARLSDARTPLTHSHAPGDVTGTAVVTNDSRLSDARTPLSHAISSHTGYPVDASGYLKNNGTGTLSWDTPAGGSSPPWYGALYAARGNCDPILQADYHDMLAVAGPTPTAITASIARCVMFRPPAAMSCVRVRLLGVGAVSSIYKFAIYPVGAGASRLWESGTVTSAANTWNAITCSFSLAANTNYWWCVTVTTTGTTAGFRSPAAPTGTNMWGANAAPLGNRSMGLPTCAQFAVTSGAFPATLPSVAAAAYAGGTTGTVPFGYLDASA